MLLALSCMYVMYCLFFIVMSDQSIRIKINTFSSIVLDRETLDLRLFQYPQSSDHSCAPSSTSSLIKQCLNEIKECVRKDATRAIPDLYLEVRSKYCSALTYDEKLVFLQELPSFRNIRQGLYNIRRDIIPPAPQTQTDFNVNQ